MGRLDRLLGKAKRIKIGIFQHHPEPHHPTGHGANLAAGGPRHDPIDGVAKEARTVRKREAGNRFCDRTRLLSPGVVVAIADYSEPSHGWRKTKLPLAGNQDEA